MERLVAFQTATFACKHQVTCTLLFLTFQSIKNKSNLTVQKLVEINFPRESILGVALIIAWRTHSKRERACVLTGGAAANLVCVSGLCDSICSEEKITMRAWRHLSMMDDIPRGSICGARDDKINGFYRSNCSARADAKLIFRTF
jgi:hypothetical protein